MKELKDPSKLKGKKRPEQDYYTFPHLQWEEANRGPATTAGVKRKLETSAPVMEGPRHFQLRN